MRRKESHFSCRVLFNLGIVLVFTWLSFAITEKIKDAGAPLRFTEAPNPSQGKAEEGSPIPGPKSWCKPFQEDLDHWKRIIFLETSGHKCLKTRQVCTVESAARMNPDLNIYVYMASRPAPGLPEDDKGSGLQRDCTATKLLKQFPNVHFVQEDLTVYFRNTPLWDLYQSGVFKKSHYSFQHLSDAVRIAMLYKTGGIYLDLDLIVVRPLHCLVNAAGFVKISFYCIENDVLVFEKGHPLLWYFMENMKTLYKPNERSSIGPNGLTTAFRQHCNYNNEVLQASTLYRCNNHSHVVLYGPEAFHPIGYFEREQFFNPVFKTSSDLELLRSSFTVHVYGSGHGAKAPETCLFNYLAKHYCPRLHSYSMKTYGLYTLIAEPSEDLPALKVPGVDSLCPEFRQNAGFTERISFIHTSGRSCMTPRNLCGIESAARANPNMTVYVYMNIQQNFKDPTEYGPDQYGKTPSCEVTRILGMYPNIRVIHENLVDYLKDTKFWPLYEKGLFEKSAWSLIHLSDALRLAILTKFGGFYLDFDTITFRPLHCLRNSASFLEDYPHIENGILVFDKDHGFLKFLQRFVSRMYDPAVRMTLGPPSVGKAFMMYCSKHRLETGNYACFNNTPVNLIHPDSFYPIRHSIWKHLYTPDIKEEDVQRMKNSYLAHIYGANWGYEVPKTSLYASLARYYCPQVWNLTRAYEVKDGF